MGKDDIDPHYSTGTYVEPDQWNELIEDEETLLIDTEMNMKLVLVVLKMQLIRIPIHFVNFLVLLMNTSILISTKKLLCFALEVFAAKNQLLI